MFTSVSQKIVMAALLTVASIHSTEAFGQRGPGRRGPPAHTAPVYPPPYQPGPGYNDTETAQIYIGRSVMNEVLPLRQLARLNQNYAGYEIVSVSANTQSNSPYRTDVELISDNYVVARQINPGRQINLYPQQRLILDQNVRTLQLSVRGSTYVDVIYITLRRPQHGGQNPGYPQPPVRPQPPQQPPVRPQPPQQPPVRPQPPVQPPQQPVHGGTTITGGQTLHQGQQWVSPNGQVTLVMQNDCNLVLYVNGRPSRATTRTIGNANCMAAFQTDGNFVVYSNGSPLWNSQTSGHHGAHMLLQNDGNLVIYSGGRPVWDAISRM